MFPPGMLPGPGVNPPKGVKLAATGTAPITFTASNLPGWLTLSESGLLSGTQSSSAYENGQWDRTIMERPAARYDMAQVMYNLLQAKGISMPSAEALAACRAEIPDYAAIPVQYRPAVETMYTLGCLKGTSVRGAASPRPAKCLCACCPRQKTTHRAVKTASCRKNAWKCCS